MAKTFLPKNSGMTAAQVHEYFKDELDQYNEFCEEDGKRPTPLPTIDQLTDDDCQKFVDFEFNTHDDDDDEEDRVDMMHDYCIKAIRQINKRKTK